MKKKILLGALVACFASPNLYAATCSDTGTDDYDDQCTVDMQLDIPKFAVIAVSTDLSVTWDGTSTGTSTDSVDICVGTNGDSGVNVTASSANTPNWNVSDGTTDVPYTLTLAGGSLTDGSEALAAATVTNLACAATDITLELGFDNTVLATTPTDGATSFTDTVTLTVSPQ